jgi:hypothetical protein
VSTPQGRYRALSLSASSQGSSYDDAEEVNNLLSVLSPHASHTHTPERCCESLTAQMTTMDVEEGMPGGMKGSEGNGKQPENPPLGPSSLGGYDPFFGPSNLGGGNGSHGGGTQTNDWNDGSPTTPSQKRHIQKPAEFMDTKNWDKFKRQEFLYAQEYDEDFLTHLSRIRFNLSFFAGDYQKSSPPISLTNL